MVFEFFLVFFLPKRQQEATHYPNTSNREESGCQLRKINFVLLLVEAPTTTV